VEIADKAGLSGEVARWFDRAGMGRCGRIPMASVPMRAMVTNKETVCIFGHGISSHFLFFIKEIGYMDFGDPEPPG